MNLATLYFSYVEVSSGSYGCECTLVAVVTVSGKGQLLRSWEISSGVLKYEVSTSLPIGEWAESSLTSLTQSWRPSGVSATLAGKNKGELKHRRFYRSDLNIFQAFLSVKAIYHLYNDFTLPNQYLASQCHG